MKNTQRASETQKIRQQINHIKTEMSPKIVVRPIRSHPKPRPGAGQWFNRTVRVTATSGASASNISVTIGNVIAAITGAGAGFTGSLKVLGLNVWNMTPPATTSGSLRVDLAEQTVLINGSIGEQTSTDWGNSTASPGLRFDIPDQFAAIRTSVNAPDVICVCSSVQGTNNQTFVLDVQLLISY
jgi:hypothetical protein